MSIDELQIPLLSQDQFLAIGSGLLSVLIAGVTSLAYMVALLRRAIRDDLTGIFARNSGEEIIQVSGLGKRPDGTALTASIGLAERYFDQIESPVGLLELADQRMYKAKAAGRNRIQVL